MAKAIAIYRQPVEGKYQPFEVPFGDVSKPETVTTYKFKTDGTTHATCEVKDEGHLAALIASGCKVEAAKGEDVSGAEAEAERLVAENKAKEEKEAKRLANAAHAKQKLARAKTKPEVASLGTI
jgi:hypothetical protein